MMANWYLRNAYECGEVKIIKKVLEVAQSLCVIIVEIPALQFSLGNARRKLLNVFEQRLVLYEVVKTRL